MAAEKQQILICDDSLFIRKQLKEFITQNLSYEVLEASDGQAAVDLYVKHKPRLVIMDIVMPVLNGLEALAKIKEVNPEAKVIMLSSSGTKSYLLKAIEVGAADFLQKPWDEAQIKNILNKALS